MNTDIQHSAEQLGLFKQFPIQPSPHSSYFLYSFVLFSFPLPLKPGGGGFTLAKSADRDTIVDHLVHFSTSIAQFQSILF